MALKEKSLVAYTPSDGKILAFGDEAEKIAGKNVEGVQVISPLRHVTRVEELLKMEENKETKSS